VREIVKLRPSSPCLQGWGIITKAKEVEKGMTVRLQVSDGNGTIVAHVASTAQSQMETNPTNHVDNHTKTILNKDENYQFKNHNLRKISSQSRISISCTRKVESH
jgi:hypothetical protein